MACVHTSKLSLNPQNNSDNCRESDKLSNDAVLSKVLPSESKVYFEDAPLCSHYVELVGFWRIH